MESFGQAAHRVQQAGFDGIEIHAAHHYFLHSFLSPVTNHRTDEYGGSLEHRARILQEVVLSIRAHCGPDFPVMVRVSLEEYIGPKGYHADTGLKLCQMLASWGVDALNVSASGTDSKGSQSVEPMPYRQGWRKHLPWLVKQTVSIPVLAVALIRDPAFAEQLLADRVLDFAASARSHLADPNWANKAFAGQEADILPCISCMACFSKFDGEGHITCAVNPETGYEAQLPPLPQDGDKRLVVVLGGGPAGLGGAWIAARRGFRVILFEKQAVLGGQLNLAALAPGKEKIHWLLDSLTRRCQQAGVELHPGHAPTLDELNALHPYAILDATGGLPAVPARIPGAQDSPLVCTPPDILTGKLQPTGEVIAVIGSGMTGLETAEILSAPEEGQRRPGRGSRPAPGSRRLRLEPQRRDGGLRSEQRRLPHQPRLDQGRNGPHLPHRPPDRRGIYLPLSTGRLSPRHDPDKALWGSIGDGVFPRALRGRRSKERHDLGRSARRVPRRERTLTQTIWTAKGLSQNDFSKSYEAAPFF